MRAREGVEAALEKGGTKACVPSDSKAHNPRSRELAGLPRVIWSMQGKHAVSVLLLHGTAPTADTSNQSQESLLLV